MMFLFHSGMMLALIAIGLGIGLYIWGLRHEGAGIQLARVVGVILPIVAILGMLCSGYYALKYWHEGYFESPAAIEKTR